MSEGPAKRSTSKPPPSLSQWEAIPMGLPVPKMFPPLFSTPPGTDGSVQADVGTVVVTEDVEVKQSIRLALTHQPWSPWSDLAVMACQANAHRQGNGVNPFGKAKRLECVRKGDLSCDGCTPCDP
eukprot:scaffold115206_cov31-Tisochrysis_lutea.AAC.4